MPVFPTLNAALNLTATALLVIGVRHARAGRYETHKRFMIGALCASALFLTSYLIYHGTSEPNRFRSSGPVAWTYYFVLATHTPLAALVPFLALRTAWLGWKDRRESHRRWARWTYPIWLYVSVTGVLIYLMLYHLDPWLVGA